MTKVRKWKSRLDGFTPIVNLEYENGEKRKLTPESKPRNEVERKVIEILGKYSENAIHYAPGRGFSWVHFCLFCELEKVLGYS
ncbi:MAG TPA: hypothetical protein ENJ61_00205 [Aquifex aeolicus]|uniref:Uncharacterized protein n=1 Tax=Aquifex aeolicus TaxID=63363 RepID=A0A7C5L5K4_AQUAO|nr:hypothetical protein [Aquifex aeolicus]